MKSIAFFLSIAIGLSWTPSVASEAAPSEIFPAQINLVEDNTSIFDIGLLANASSLIYSNVDQTIIGGKMSQYQLDQYKNRRRIIQECPSCEVEQPFPGD